MSDLIKQYIEKYQLNERIGGDVIDDLLMIYKIEELIKICYLFLPFSTQSKELLMELERLKNKHELK